MNKRGQVSIFVIIGIIIIIIILLFLFLRNRVDIGPLTGQNLESQFPQIREHIEDCLIEVGEPRIRQIGLQGGYINTPVDTFRLYKDNKASYLCYNIENTLPCRSRILRQQDLEQQLNQFLLQDLQTQCLNINAFDKAGFDLIQGQLKIETRIDQDSVLIEANYPITLRRAEELVEQSEYSAIITLPLGRLFEATRDIIDSESTTGLFDTTPYSLVKSQLTGKPYITQRIPIYPDELYILKIADTPPNDEYIFQFWVEGEPR